MMSAFALNRSDQAIEMQAMSSFCNEIIKKSSVSILLVIFFLVASLSKAVEISTRTFNPEEIRVQMSVDVDIVYHVLAHFAVPGDPSNLYSEEYVAEIRQAKKDLETGLTKLDQYRKSMEPVYQQHPRLRFLNLALFMADDYSSFKQALLKVDNQLPPEEGAGNKETLEERRTRDSHFGLMFGNTRRLVPLFQKRFPEPAERQFVKLFAECLEDEYSNFYKVYREARTELEDSKFEKFMLVWKSRGLDLLRPWAARSGVNIFNVYLSAVLRNNGRGIPVKEDQRVIFNVVAPLPETRDQQENTLFVILHETTHRLTDQVVESVQSVPEVEFNRTCENAVFYADLLYLKSRYPTLQGKYMQFFLNLPAEKPIDMSVLESQFRNTYSLPSTLQSSIEQLVKNLS